MINENSKETMNIYYLDNLTSCSDNRTILRATTQTKIIINYGNKMDEAVLNIGDTIRWADNVIISSGKLDHYKSRVAGEKLVVISEDNLLERIEYVEPPNASVAPGTGWDARH